MKAHAKMAKGTGYIAVGLLLIAAALLLTGRNLFGERRAQESSYAALTELEQIVRAELEGYISDRDGNAIDWPLLADGSPMGWPLDEEGRPLVQVADAQGMQYFWPAERSGDPERWNKDRAGALLPWITDASGTQAWTIDAGGYAATKAAMQEQLAARKNEMEWLSQPDYVRNPEMEMPTEKIRGNYYVGTLEIETLGLKLPIISEWSYPRLNVAPCRYAGTAYKGNMVIAGHNFRNHFGHLDRLAIGDAIRFTDMKGNVFSYEVIALETLERDEVEEMLFGDWDLTLFTCTYGGGQRVTVRCAHTE